MLVASLRPGSAGQVAGTPGHVQPEWLAKWTGIRNAAKKSFADRIHPGRLNGGLQHADADAPGNSIECGAVLVVAIADQQLGRLPERCRLPEWSLANDTPARVSIAEHPTRYLIPGHVSVSGDLCNHGCQGTYSQGIVSWDGHVVLSACRGRESQVAARLARYHVSESAERAGQRVPRYVARQPHAAMISSRTKCRRMTDGRWASSK